jgi:competence protein ComEC
MQVALLPVGGGQCAIVRSPSGATMMVDCGGNTGGPGAGPRLAEDVISPWLSQHRIRRLDWVVITHWDADHFNALASVLERVPCEMVLLPPELPEARMPDELREVLTARAVHAWSGGVVRLGAGVRAEVLSPRRPLLTGTEDDANNNSIVLRLTHVVCLPHHGRSLEATWRLLELAGPEWAVVSCDRQAGYYLDADEQARLAAMGIRVLRTDTDGAITVTTDGRRLRVTGARASR